MQMPHGGWGEFNLHSCPKLKYVSKYLAEHGSPEDRGRFMVIPNIHREDEGVHQCNQHFSDAKDSELEF